MDALRLKVRLELLWWGFTLVAVCAVLLPIWLHTHDYPFYGTNALFVILTITFTRYIFLLKHTWMARFFWPKMIVLAFSAILIFTLLTAFGDFRSYLDEEGLQVLTTHLPIKRQYRIMGYIRTEMVFFGVSSIIAAMVLPVRMLVSIWRVRNRDTV